MLFLRIMCNHRVFLINIYKTHFLLPNQQLSIVNEVQSLNEGRAMYLHTTILPLTPNDCT